MVGIPDPIDINLPDGRASELPGRSIRKHARDPGILLTANDTDLDIVDGLERGADDYIQALFLRFCGKVNTNRESKRQTIKMR